MQGDNFIYVVPVAHLYHTLTHPFCFEEDCPCHTTTDNIAKVQEDYNSGLLTAEEANLILKGKAL